MPACDGKDSRKRKRQSSVISLRTLRPDGQTDGATKARIAFLSEQSVQGRRDEKEWVIRPITFSTNDILNGLWDIASKGASERARVSALMGLADIFLLRAKCIRD